MNRFNRNCWGATAEAAQDPHSWRKSLTFRQHTHTHEHYAILDSLPIPFLPVKEEDCHFHPARSSSRSHPGPCSSLTTDPINTNKLQISFPQTKAKGDREAASEGQEQIAWLRGLPFTFASSPAAPTTQQTLQMHSSCHVCRRTHTHTNTPTGRPRHCNANRDSLRLRGSWFSNHLWSFREPKAH